MKISIGPITFEIHFPKFSSRKINPVPWAQEAWNSGIGTCERLYGNLTERITEVSNDENTKEAQNKVNLILEETLPFPKTHKEVALQGIIRRCLVVDPLRQASNSNLFAQFRHVGLLEDIPYKLPHPSNIPLKTMLDSISSLCKSIVHPDYKAPVVTVPFIDYLKAGKVNLYSEVMAEALYEEFLSSEMDGLVSCHLVEQLAYCVLGLYQLLIVPTSLNGELSSAVVNQKKGVKESIDTLSELLDELGDLIVPESGGLSHYQLIRYQQFATTKLLNTKHYSRLNSHLDHALTVDPLNNRFFVHLKKKGLLNTSLYRNKTQVVHLALMVTKEKTKLIYDVTKERKGSVSVAVGVMQAFKSNTYIIDPPIDFSTYHKVSYFRESYLTDLGTICNGTTKISELNEKISLLESCIKGLHTLHQSDYLHGSISPQSFLLKPNSKTSDSAFQGVLGNLETVDKVDEQKKAPLIPKTDTDGNVLKYLDGRPKMCRPKYLGDKRYLPPEYLLNRDEPISQKSDIWSFGVTAWQFIYGKNSDDFPYPLNEVTGLPEIDKKSLDKMVTDSMPTPRTVQESSMQLLIKRCLMFDPVIRSNSSELLMEINCVKRRPQVTYTESKPQPPSLQDLFHPFQKFEREGMGIRPGGQVVRTLRKTKSYLKLPNNSVGHRSLPPELFEIFCEQGKLKLHISEFEKRVDGLLKNDTQSMEKLQEAEQGLQQTFRVIEKLARIFNRFKPTHADILDSQRENIESSCDQLYELTTKLHKIPVEGAAGLTYHQVKTYREIRKQKVKNFKVPLGFLDETHINQPISFHFDKGSEKGLDHPVTFDPINKSLIVHIKKQGFRKKEMGKGAVKSVHEAVKLNGESIEKAADVVMRVDSFDVEEERLKHLFSGCPYIEDIAEAVTVYEKNEIPSMWKNKKNMEKAELKELEKTAERIVVQKLAFFPPLYVSSLGGLSYRKGDARDRSLLISIFGDVAEGLAVMHAHGYIHRDIKPGNILIKKAILNNLTKLFGVLADLGEAVYVGKEGVLSKDKNMAGTMHYNSPEVCFPKQHERFRCQSFASDIWALGVTMLQALYGKNGRDIPFIDNSSKIHIFSQINGLTQDSILNTLNGIFPNACSREQKKANALIVECLTIDPEKRPTARELSDKFKKI